MLSTTSICICELTVTYWLWMVNIRKVWNCTRKAANFVLVGNIVKRIVTKPNYISQKVYTNKCLWKLYKSDTKVIVWIRGQMLIFGTKNWNSISLLNVFICWFFRAVKRSVMYYYDESPKASSLEIIVIYPKWSSNNIGYVMGTMMLSGIERGILCFLVRWID